MNITIFAQILHKLPRERFKKLVDRYDSDKHSKGINSWTHLVSMLFCQFAKSNSLREISYGLNSATGNLNHYGVSKAPCKSSLSYINEHRTWELFRDFYFELLKNMRLTRSEKSRLRIKRKFYILDSTVISLCLSIFDWAHYRAKKGAIKLHTLLDYDGCLPVFMELSDGKKHDTTIAKNIELPKGSLITADRAYLDLPLLYKWDRNDVFFVVRCKEIVKLDIVGENEVDKSKGQNKNIQADWICELELEPSRKKYPGKLRMVEVYDEQKGIYLELLTNNFFWTASTIAEIYKQRWQIEIFFKELKSHFKIKSFVGTSTNAVLIQIWTALITIALLKELKQVAKHPWHLSNLVAFLRLNLFVKIDLKLWLDKPFIPINTKEMQSVQMVLF